MAFIQTGEEIVTDIWILIKPDKLHASLDIYLVMPATGKLAPPQNAPIKQCLFVMETCNRSPTWHVHQWRTDITQRNFWLCNKHLTALLEDEDVINIKLQLAQFADLYSPSNIDNPSNVDSASALPSSKTEAPPNLQQMDFIRPMPQSIEDLETESRIAKKLRRVVLSANRGTLGKIFSISLMLVSFSIFFYAGWQSWAGRGKLIGGALFVVLAIAIDFLKSFWGGEES